MHTYLTPLELIFEKKHSTFLLNSDRNNDLRRLSCDDSQQIVFNIYYTWRKLREFRAQNFCMRQQSSQLFLNYNYLSIIRLFLSFLLLQLEISQWNQLNNNSAIHKLLIRRLSKKNNNKIFAKTTISLLLSMPIGTDAARVSRVAVLV